MPNDSRIMCSVNNCHYWKQGNICDASKIMITSDAFGDRQPDSFDAMQASTAEPTPAQTCMETCCKTFVTKGSRQTTADGIMRL
ncbi:hypothetical protein SY88_05730 [Clostridiales bacterium PH28_bin88]|nr:hypothetical protein SY88_05730 [Clostridiales bacterium PH28_bin88]